jgi:tetratricopeptide (TPR) repeat protein
MNRHADAVLDLQRARELSTDREQSYYIGLFLGREEELLGRFDEARGHFEAAAALFPRAQSPWLSLSRLAAYRGDVSGARQAIDSGLRDVPGDYSEDPWWIYDLGPGRYAGAMLRQIYEAAGGGQP